MVWATRGRIRFKSSEGKAKRHVHPRCGLVAKLDHSLMSIPPEVAFDRYVRDHTPYRGKQDLDRLSQPGLRSLLTAIQATLNQGLNEMRSVPEHVDHPPFHLDYIDSNAPNALAFGDDDHSFIGLTMGLISLFSDLCVRLSRSEAIAALLRIRLEPDVSEGLQAMVFTNLLSFLVTHEFTHVVHGHVEERRAPSISFNEIQDDGETGNLKEQVMEADMHADIDDRDGNHQVHQAVLDEGDQCRCPQTGGVGVGGEHREGDQQRQIAHEGVPLATQTDRVDDRLDPD